MSDIANLLEGIEQLEITTYPKRVMGGQHVGSTPTGVSIHHPPSGLTAICESERSRHRNREIAMEMLVAGLTSPKRTSP